jgi:hypothetical protein
MGARYVWINVLVGGLFAVAVDAERRLIFEQQYLPDLGIDFSNISTPPDAANAAIPRGAPASQKTPRPIRPRPRQTIRQSASVLVFVF